MTEEGSTSMVLTAEWCPRVERTASTGHSKNRGQRNTHWMFRYQCSTLIGGWRCVDCSRSMIGRFCEVIVMANDDWSIC